MALASPLGWGWLGVKERSAALRVWWWTRSIDNDTPWAKLLRFARDNDLLDKSWTCAYENFLKLQILRVEGEGSLLTYSPASDQHDAKTIPTSAARFSHVKEALQLCPKVLTSQLLTDGQRRIYSSPEPLSNLLKLSQSLPLSASIKTWYKLALHHAAPGIYYADDANLCRICKNPPQPQPHLHANHLLHDCSLLSGFKTFAYKVFRNHPLGQTLRDHGPWFPTLPRNKILATFIIITLHVAWKARCCFRYSDTPIDPLPEKFIRMVLDDYRQHVVVTQRRLFHRKVGRFKQPPQHIIHEWLLPGHLYFDNGFLTVCI